MPAAQRGQDARQQEWTHRRDDAEAQRAAERLARGLRELRKFLGVGEQAPRALDDLPHRAA